MAQLALAAGGGLLGAATGIPFAGAIGWVAGGLAGAALFRDRPPGPQLGDLTVQSSTYGTGIPRVFGTARIAGNIIWTSGIRVEDQKPRGLGKGGGVLGGGDSDNRPNTYASWGVSFCRGPASAIRKLWFDEKLVYDASGGSVQLTLPGLVWRWQEGTEDQLPDAMYEAAVGADEAVAYRGEVVMWFEEVPLKDLGNRIPNVTAEIVMAGATVGIVAAQSGAASGGPDAYDTALAVDWERRVLFSRQNVAGVASLVETNLDTMASRGLGIAEPGQGTTRLLERVGDYLALGAGSGNSCPIVIYDANSGAELRRFGFYAGTLFITTANTTTPWANVATGFTVYGLTRTRRFLIYAPFGTAVGSYCIDLDLGAYVWGAASNALFSVPQYALWAEGEQRPNETDVWCAGGSGTDIVLRKVTVTDFAEGVVGGASDGLTNGVTPGTAVTIAGASVGLTGGSVVVSAVIYDPSDDCVIVAAYVASGPARLIKLADDGTVLWSVPALALPGTGRSGHRLVNRTLGILGGTVGYLYDTATGALISESALGAVTVAGAQIYDSQRQAVWTYGAGLQRFLIGRSTPADPLLADVVTSICGDAGLEPADLDVTALSGTVAGYVLARPMTARDAITPIGSAYLFDAVESDDLLRFVPRGGATVATIAHADLVREGEGGVIAEPRAQDVELPRTVVVRHMDPARAYEPGAQRWPRPQAPTPTMSSRHATTLDLPLVLTADEAKAIARRQVTAAWRERARFSFTGTTQHLRIEPTDPVTLTLADGSTVRTRVISAQLGADWTMRVEAVGEDAADYALTAVADGGSGRAPDVLPAVYSVRGFVPALPLLDDGDDLGGTALRGYVAAGTYGSETWLGADAWRSDGGAYGYAGRMRGIAAWGVLTAEVPVPASYWVWDDATTISVAMRSGAARIEPCTDLEALNGANLACLISSAGAVEVIRFVGATVGADGTASLTRLIRGVRGTEDAGAFPAGSLFLLLDGSELAITSALSRLNGAEAWRFIGVYDRVDDAPGLSRSVSGRAERPYAPVQLAGARDGSNNLTLTWVRRTRIGGEWMDFTETVPLAEASELYEVQIRDAGDMTTLRTITGITSPTTTYSATNQSADGITPGDSVRFRVRQISATVGGGTWGAATV